MPLPNTRVVIQGVARADKEFTVVENSAREAQRVVALVAKDLEQAKREVERALRGKGR